MKLKKTAIALLLLVSLVLWLGAQRYASNESGLPPLETTTVDRGDVSQRTVAYGALQPVQRVTVGSQVSGIVDQLFADFNSFVSRGEVVAQIDPSTFEAEVRSAEAELESAEASLELARHQWQRVQELRELQFVPPSDVDEARAALSQAEAQLRVRRHALERAERELERTTITAPADGIVIHREVDEGQTVAASLNAPILFEIASDLTRMHIHANVSEADIGTVEEGQQVRFTVDAHRDRELEGVVIQVRNAPIMEDNVVHYETIIRVDNDEGLLRPGMTAEVAIITNERHDVVRARNTALRARLPDDIRPEEPENSGGDATVYVVRDGQLVAVRVQTGLSDGLYTEILDGLEEGDVLAVGLSLTDQDEGRGGSGFFSGQQQVF